MTTQSEEQFEKEMRDKGYTYVHCGAPDYIIFKFKDGKKVGGVKDIDISTVEFAEVKFNGDSLHHEQLIWKHILEGLGLKYKLVHIPSSQIGLK